MATNLYANFDLGQEVHIVRKDAAYRNVKCDACRQTGTIDLGGESFTCPKCEGKSKHRQYVGHKCYVAHTGRVGKIEAVVYSERYEGDGSESGIRYMVDTTGVGSGNVWKEEELFATREEADAFCAKSNSSTNWNDDE